MCVSGCWTSRTNRTRRKICQNLTDSYARIWICLAWKVPDPTRSGSTTLIFSIYYYLCDSWPGGSFHPAEQRRGSGQTPTVYTCPGTSSYTSYFIHFPNLAKVILVSCYYKYFLVRKTNLLTFQRNPNRFILKIVETNTWILFFRQRSCYYFKKWSTFSIFSERNLYDSSCLP